MAERNMVNLTVTMINEGHKELKQIALHKDSTVFGLFCECLWEYQKEDKK